MNINIILRYMQQLKSDIKLYLNTVIGEGRDTLNMVLFCLYSYLENLKFIFANLKFSFRLAKINMYIFPHPNFWMP